MKELLLFQAGNIQFGLNLPLVKSIQSVNARFAEQAGRSHKLVQVMDGEEFPLYDLPSILRDETSSDDPMSQKVILVEAHEHPIALGVDRVERVVSVNSDHIHPLPLIFNGLPLNCFPLVLKHEDELILLLNPEGIRNCKSEMPDTETNTPKQEAMKPLLEEKETPKPMAQAASNINEIPHDSSQKSKVANGEPTSDVPYSEFTPPDEIEKEQSDLDNYPSETIGIDPDFEEGTTSRFVKEAMIAWEELPKIEPFQPEKSILYGEQEQFGSELSAIDADAEEKTAVANVDQTAAETSKESFQPEESILSDQQEQVGSELSAMNASLEETTPDTEDSDAHDTEEKATVADVDETAAETSPDEDKVKTGAEGGHFETASLDQTTESYKEMPGETQHVEGKDELDVESNSAFEGGKPVAVVALPQIAADQPEEIVSLKEAEAVVETPEPESTDPFRSAKEDKDMPLLPVGEVPYLFAAVSTESEPIPIEPADIVSLKEAEAAVETPEDESNDHLRSAKEDKDMPLLPVGEVPYLFAAVSTESEPIPIEPAEAVSLKEAEGAVETPEPESTDHLRFAEEDTKEPLLPVSEVSSLLAAVSTESEPISIGPDDFILSDSSDTIKSACENQSEKALTPPGLTRELEIDHGKRKSLRQRLVAVGMLALVALLSLSMWLWLMSTHRMPEVANKPIPLFHKIREIREKPEELSQIPQPLNTGERATGTAHTSLKTGAEVFKIETNGFTLTVERPTAKEKNGRPPASAGMIGKNKYSHIVVQDDTLWQIAERYLDDPFRYPELAERSRISNPDRIYPGDVVRIIKKNEQRKEKTL